MISIRNETKGKLPRLSFHKIKDSVLGKHYELSLVFIKSAASQKLNKKYRARNMPANVLSFSLSENDGEIFIDLKEAKKDAPLFGESPKQFTKRLFIHALLHLKGFSHGSKMEGTETKLIRKFSH